MFSERLILKGRILQLEFQQLFPWNITETMASTLHVRFPFLCFTLVGQSSHPLVILSMYSYLMHVNIHRHFICLSCTDGEVFIQKKVGDRYWQAQNIRKDTKVNILQEFWNSNHQTLGTLNVHLIIALQSSAVSWYKCCGLTWIQWYLNPWYAHPHLNKVNVQLSRPPANLWSLQIVELCSESWVIFIMKNGIPFSPDLCRFPGVSCRRMWLFSADSSPCLSGSLELLTSCASFQLTLLWIHDCMENNANYSYNLTKNFKSACNCFDICHGFYEINQSETEYPETSEFWPWNTQLRVSEW